MKATPIHRQQAAAEGECRESYADVMRRRIELAAQEPTLTTKKLDAKLHSNIEQMKLAVANAIRLLDGDLAKSRVKNAGETRLFCQLRDILRSPKEPDLLHTTMFIVAAFFVEGFAAGSMFAADGYDPLAGYTYGFAFSAINISLGVMTGFWPLRYFNLKHHDEMPVARCRRMARTAFFAGIGSLALLIFSAARVRATGDHRGVFDFDEIGFWQTFNDSMTLGITFIGIMSSVIAIAKGWSGISDPIPQYLETYKRGYEQANHPAEGLVVSVQDRLYDLYLDGLDAHEDFLEQQEEYQDYIDEVKDYGQMLQTHDLDVTTLETESLQRKEAENYISGNSHSTIKTDHSELRIPIEETLKTLAVPAPKDITPDVVEKFETVYQTATAELSAALLRFLNTDFMPDDPDDSPGSSSSPIPNNTQFNRAQDDLEEFRVINTHH